MAYSFTSNAHQIAAVIDGTVVAAPPVTGTVSFWFKPNWTAGDSLQHVLFDYAGNTGNISKEFSFQQYSDNNIYVGWNQFSGDQRITTASTSAMFTSGTWTNHIIAWDDSAEETRYYANNVEVGTRLATISPNPSLFLGDGYLTLGNVRITIANGPCTGSLAEFAIWDVVLTSGERDSLAKGFTPRLVRPESNLNYWPLVRELQTELTLTGASVVPHSRIIMPRRRTRGMDITPPPAPPETLFAQACL